MADETPEYGNKASPNSGITRQDFIKYVTGTVACVSFGSLIYGCGSNHKQDPFDLEGGRNGRQC
ncbi:MAG: hypothetical protein EG822_11840 [Deltaproteobacteria bacterium]|nr:hypothetical protein [Deltaproteobacteria bacterium]TLN04203.1 MAG: hypothetical protein FDZ73_04830 [bacterium]